MEIPIENEIFFDYFISAAAQEKRNTYFFGLNQILEKMHIGKITSAASDKNLFEDSYIVLAQDKNGDSLGGIRVEVRTPTNQLPLEKCDLPYQSMFNIKLNKILDEGKSVAEICGLWANTKPDLNINANKLGMLLTVEATELALGLGIDVLTAIVPRHTINYARAVGYERDPEIPRMAYPDDRFLSGIIWHYGREHYSIRPIQTELNYRFL